MRVSAVFGLNATEKHLREFQQDSGTTWLKGLPASNNDADVILIFGGDGTVHRCLPDLVKLQLPVLVVPWGSGNDFARALGLRRTGNALAAWKTFVSGRRNVRAIDLGMISALSGPAAAAHYFCCVGGVGLDAEVARRAQHLPRWLRAHGGYALSFLPAVFQFAPVQMRISYNKAPVDSKPTVLAAFANVPTYGGGMKIAPHAQLDDGQLDLCIIRDIDPLKLFCLFPTIYFGGHLRRPEVQYLQINRLQIETERPLDVYADGEYICKTPIEVRVLPRALTVITP